MLSMAKAGWLKDAIMHQHEKLFASSYIPAIFTYDNFLINPFSFHIICQRGQYALFEG